MITDLWNIEIKNQKVKNFSMVCFRGSMYDLTCNILANDYSKIITIKKFIFNPDNYNLNQIPIKDYVSYDIDKNWAINISKISDNRYFLSHLQGFIDSNILDQLFKDNMLNHQDHQ